MVKILIIGYLGKDAIVNQVNGKNVINFSVAHTEKYKNNSGAQQEKTTWFECAKWDDNTAVAPYLTKGTKVFVEGRVELKTFQKSDGTTGASMVVSVGSIELLGSAQQQQPGFQAPQQAGAGYPPAQQYPPQPGQQHMGQPYGQQQAYPQQQQAPQQQQQWPAPPPALPGDLPF